MSKTEVYSWRIAPHIKRTLEREARREGTSVAVLLERIAKEWFSNRDMDRDEGDQARLRVSVQKTIGTIAGKQSRRAELARTAVRKRISRRHAS